MTQRTSAAAALVVLAAAVTGPGCANNRQSLGDERMTYGDVLLASWKDQLLLNTVRMRYLDPPMLLDVASIIQQHSVSGESTAAASFDPGKWSGLTAAIGGRSTFEDRPTFTYAPVRGEQFTRTLLTPVSPAVLSFLLASDWPADILFGVYVKSVNGLRNRSGAGRRARPADPGFDRLVSLLQAMQNEGRVALQIQRPPEGSKAEVIVMTLPSDGSPESLEARRLLGLAPAATEFAVRYSPIQMGDRDVAMVTRSMAEVMLEFSSAVEVPAAEVAEGRAVPALPHDPAAGPALRIRRCGAQPKDAYASALYHGQWYCIDSTDLASKAIFTVSLLILSLTETGGSAVAPVVTISTN